MEQHVDVYEGLADREYVILAPDQAAMWIRDLFERNGWEGDPAEVEPAWRLDLLEEDDDGNGLYGSHWQRGGRYSQYIWLRPDEDAGDYEQVSRWMDSDPRVDALVDAIEDAGSLDALCEALNSLAGIGPDLRDMVEDEIDTTELPTFGGEPPADETTDDVWSWDENRLLVGTWGDYPFRIIPR